MALTREQILKKYSGKPPKSPSKRALLRKAHWWRTSKPLADFSYQIACERDLYRRLGAPMPTDLEDLYWTHVAEEIARWTDVRLSGTEIANHIDPTDLYRLLREAVERREDYLDKAIEDRKQRAAALRQLNPTDLAAASYIAKHPGCTGVKVAKEIGVSGEHFRKFIVPKLKPFGLWNRGGYYMPALRAV